jgi:hypothetical protein
LPQDAHFSNKVDIWDSNDRFEADDSTQMAENAYCLSKIHDYSKRSRDVFILSPSFLNYAMMTSMKISYVT